MSLKVCCAEQMLSTPQGLGMARAWFPRTLAEAFLESTKDGPIKIAPDPVTMIDGDLTWYNDTGSVQDVWMHLRRAPRTVVAQSPSTVVIHDAWTHQIGMSPSAEFPSVMQDEFGGRLAIDRASAAADKMLFARVFIDSEDSQVVTRLGLVQPDESLHFRYLAAVQTPGVWVSPTEFDARWEAYARWTRLIAVGVPALSEVDYSGSRSI